MTAAGPPAAGALAFRSAARSHVGAVRKLNEDSFVERADAQLWAVADGMGGHHAGDVASALVAQSLEALGGFNSGYAFLHAVTTALQEANEALVRKALELPLGTVIGATAVALIVEEQHAACVWAGDSRAYHLQGGTMRRLTRDHSVVQELIDAGTLGPEDLDVSGRAHLITRAIGAAPELELDTVYATIEPGDRFLLCSDGLTGELSDAEIAALLGLGDVTFAADKLMDTALSRDPTDNVTLIVIESALADA